MELTNSYKFHGNHKVLVIIPKIILNNRYYSKNYNKIIITFQIFITYDFIKKNFFLNIFINNYQNRNMVNLRELKEFLDMFKRKTKKKHVLTKRSPTHLKTTKRSLESSYLNSNGIKKKSYSRPIIIDDSITIGPYDLDTSYNQKDQECVTYKNHQSTKNHEDDTSTIVPNDNISSKFNIKIRDNGKSLSSRLK